MAGAVQVQDPIIGHFAETNFVHISTRNLNGRVVYKFCIGDEATAEDVRVLRRLFDEFRNLIPTFSLQEEDLIALLPKHAFLTINASAVSLAADRKSPPQAQIEYIDRFFSETLLEDPVRCSERHCLERSRAQFWIAHGNRFCPEGQHVIGELRVDAELQERIASFREDLAAEQRERAEQLQRLASIERTQEVQGRVVAYLGRGHRKIDKPFSAMEASKFVVKIGSKEVGINAARIITSKEIAKAVGKAMGKHAVPIASAGIGVACGVYRFKKGEIAKGILEIISGGIVFIPGFGFFISLGIDMLLFAHDVKYSSFFETKGLADLYQIIGIPQDNRNPTKEEVDEAFQLSIQALHPDGIIEEDGYAVITSNDAEAALNAARDEIYEMRKWGKHENIS